MDEDQTCPKNPDGPGEPHSPDWTTISVEYDGGEAYIEVNCRFCGGSGCIGTDKLLQDGITW
jgi:hypothetical protein